MNSRDSNALEALQIFLDDHKVVDIDVEPKGGPNDGWTITAKRLDGRVAFSSWGKTVEDAVVKMVRSIRG